MRKLALIVAAVALLASADVGYAQSAAGTPVYSSLPSVTPPNTWSQCFECWGVSELGDEIRLEASTPRRAGFAEVMLSNWARWSDWAWLPSGGFSQEFTLNIYETPQAAAAHTPAKSVTQTFTIPWRPANDPVCTDGSSWKATNGGCYHGFASVIVFDLRGLNYNLPTQFIYGIAQNTQNAGYNPKGVSGPYDSLNVAFAVASNPDPDLEAPYAPSVGTDVNKDVDFINYSNLANYTPPSPGSGALRPDTGWTGYGTFAVKFTTFSTAKSEEDCKNGAWQNVARKDFSQFTNQTTCLAYVRGDKRDEKKDEKDKDR